MDDGVPQRRREWPLGPPRDARLPASGKVDRRRRARDDADLLRRQAERRILHARDAAGTASLAGETTTPASRPSPEAMPLDYVIRRRRARARQKTLVAPTAIGATNGFNQFRMLNSECPF